MEHKIQNDIYLVGDIHGYPRPVLDIAVQGGLHDCSLVFLGDIGLGFSGDHTGCAKFLDREFGKLGITCWLFRGNHDNPESYNERKGEIEKTLPHVKILQDHDVVETADGRRGLIVPGSLSIDRYRRKEGASYWRNETMDYGFVPEEEYDFVLAHSGPTPKCLTHHTGGIFDSMCMIDPALIGETKREQDYVDLVIEKARPKFWANGHFHVHEFFEYKGVDVFALDCNEIMKLPEK